MIRSRRLWCVLVLVSAPAFAQAPTPFLTGVNLSGAEFGQASLPGVYNTHYTYPNQAEVDYFRGKGMNCLRLCFRWERLQRTTNAPFHTSEFSRFHGFVSQTTAKAVHVILDPHNFARFYPNPPQDYQSASQGLLGNDVPYSAFADFWSRLADVYQTNDHVIFGLMNEPANMPTENWLAAANAAIAAIRNAGAANLILVPGNGYSGAHSWSQNWYGTPNAVAMLDIVDPADNYAYEVHQYLDNDSSGTSSTIVSATIGAQRLAGFTQWLKAHNRRGFLGEFAVANSTIGAGIGDEAIRNLLAHIEANTDVWIGWTWWAAGPWWGNYMFTAKPENLLATPVDRPVMTVLSDHVPIPQPILRLNSPTQFQFEASSGFVFQPEFTTNPGTGNWTDHGPAVTGQGTSASVDMTRGGTQEYYRVRVSRAP